MFYSDTLNFLVSHKMFLEIKFNILSTDKMVLTGTTQTLLITPPCLWQ